MQVLPRDDLMFVDVRPRTKVSLLLTFMSLAGLHPRLLSMQLTLQFAFTFCAAVAREPGTGHAWKRLESHVG